MIAHCRGGHLTGFGMVDERRSPFLKILATFSATASKLPVDITPGSVASAIEMNESGCRDGMKESNVS